MVGLTGHWPLGPASSSQTPVIDGEAAWLQAILQCWRERALAAEARLAVERGASLDQATEACLEALWRDSDTEGRLPTQVVTDTMLALKSAPAGHPG